VIDSVSTKQPPLWPSVGALVLAGWTGGIVSTLLWAPVLGATAVGRMLGSPGAITATWLAPTLAGALVASAILPWALRAFCDFELGFGSAFVVTLGRGLAGFAAGAFLSALLVARGAALPSSATLFVLPEIVSVAVGYQLLKRLAEPIARLAGPELSGPSPLEQGQATATAPVRDWGQLLAGVRAEVAQTISVLARAHPTDVPGWVSQLITGFEALADRVEEAEPPNISARAAQQELVAGIRRLEGSLVDLAETAWRGDHRRELSHLGGLDEIESALAQLESVR